MTERETISLDKVADLITSDEPAPAKDITSPPEMYVRLLGGLVRAPGEAAVYNVEVRELTGAHEEAIAKAKRSPSIARFIATLLECGVHEIDGRPASRDDIKKLLIGDRDKLLLEIRRATYGPELSFEQVQCPHCGELLDVTITLDEIPIVELANPDDRVFEVPLRKNTVAEVRLPNGEDQEYILDDPELTDPERNTILLQRCVISLTDAQGVRSSVSGAPYLVRNLGVMDRRSLLNEIAKRQPGPRYDEVKFLHEMCGKEVPLRLGLGDLFPYLY